MAEVSVLRQLRTLGFIYSLLIHLWLLRRIACVPTPIPGSDFLLEDGSSGLDGVWLLWVLARKGQQVPLTQQGEGFFPCLPTSCCPKFLCSSQSAGAMPTASSRDTCSEATACPPGSGPPVPSLHGPACTLYQPQHLPVCLPLPPDWEPPEGGDHV